MSYKKADVLNFFDHFYQPKNMLVCLAGKIDEKTKQVVEKYFGQKANILKTATNFIPARFGNSSKTGRIKIQNKKTDQTQLMLGFPCFPYGHRLNSAVAVLNTVLGGSMSSRLFIRIREKLGLAYSIHSGQEKYRDSGFAYVKAGIEAKNINKAISEIKKEIDLILKKGITKRELKDAKTNIHGSTVLSLEDSSAQANWYAVESMFMKKIKTPDEKLKEIEHVSMEDVQEVAEKIFHFEKMRVGIIGSAQKQDIIF
jgi:predicted Zn-dependent peptidase